MSIGMIGADLLSARWAIQIVVTLTVPVFMLAHRLPHRPSTPLRAVLGIAALTVACVTPVATGLVTGLGVEQSFVVFAVLLAVYAALIMFVYDAGLWQALFCATAGYTLQNLASGLEVLCAILVSHRASGTLPEPWALASRSWCTQWATWCSSGRLTATASPRQRTARCWPCSSSWCWSSLASTS